MDSNYLSFNRPNSNNTKELSSCAMGDQLLNEARQRAQSRAAILQSLQSSYQKQEAHKPPNKANKNGHQFGKSTHFQSKNNNTVTKSDNNNKQKPGAADNGSYKGVKNQPKQQVVENFANADLKVVSSQRDMLDNAVNLLCQITNDSGDKNRQYFQENLHKKLIVVDNSALQKKAMKTNARIQKITKRNVRVSHRKLKSKYDYFQYLRSNDEEGKEIVPIEKPELLLMNKMWKNYIGRLIKTTNNNSIQLQVK
jgi:hypothetical protein